MTSLDTAVRFRTTYKGAGRKARQTGHSPTGLVLKLIQPVSAARKGVPRWLRRTSGPILLVLLWHLASVTGVLPPQILAGPSTVIDSAGKLIATGELQEAMWVSLGRAMGGLAIGGFVGIALALVSGLFRIGEDMVDATMQMLRTVPNVALIPLLIIWFGIGEAPKIALIALGTAFPLYLNVYAGIRNVDFTLIEAVADHVCETLFLGDSRVRRVRVKIVKLAIAEAGEAIGVTLVRHRR